MSLEVVIDRIEDNFAVCEDNDENVHLIKITKLPKNAKEGDLLIILDNGNITIDPLKTEKRKQAILKLQNDVFK